MARAFQERRNNEQKLSSDVVTHSRLCRKFSLPQIKGIWTMEDVCAENMEDSSKPERKHPKAC